MPFSQGDKVTLAASAGGWTGFVTELVGGPVSVLYRVVSKNFQSPQEGSALVAEAEVAAGPLAIASYSVGDAVRFSHQPGTITAKSGSLYTIQIEERRNADITLVRTHTDVPAWKIAMENGG